MFWFTLVLVCCQQKCLSGNAYIPLLVGKLKWCGISHASASVLDSAVKPRGDWWEVELNCHSPLAVRELPRGPQGKNGGSTTKYYSFTKPASYAEQNPSPTKFNIMEPANQQPLHSFSSNQGIEAFFDEIVSKKCVPVSFAAIIFHQIARIFNNYSPKRR